MPSFLTLPNEIIIQIICELSIIDILRCQQTCFKLNAVIKSTTEVQYHLALMLAGVEDTGANSLMSQAERLEKLRRGEVAWRKWKPQFSMKILVNHMPSPIYDLSGGIYMLGDQRMLNMSFVTLPESKEDVPKWKSIGVEDVILDVGLCIDEHDLIVAVTRRPDGSEPPQFDIGLHLIQFSTGEPHPRALHPRISAYMNKHPRPGIGIEIVGENLVLILSHRPERVGDVGQAEDKVLVFEWKTGALKMSVVAPYHSYAGLIFLNEHLLLLPNTKRGSLEVWDLPRSTTDPSPSAPLCILELPILAPGRTFGLISCRAEPNPIGESTQSHSSTPHAKRQQRPFRAKPEDAIIIFNIRIQPLQTGPHPVVAMGFSHMYTFFVHRKSILRSVLERHPDTESQRPHIDIDFPSNSALFPVPIPWEMWGQKTTRWIEADDVPTRWITTTSGQRAVLISSAAGNLQGSGSPIVVMDFNQELVKKVGYPIMMRQQREREREDRRRRSVARRLERDHAVIARRFEECKQWVERIEGQLGEIKAAAAAASPSASRSPTNGEAWEALDWPELDSSNVEQVKTFLEQHSDMAQRLKPPPSPPEDDLVLSDDDDEPAQDSTTTESDSASEPDENATSAANRRRMKNKYPRLWCLNGSQVVDRAGACFHSPVVSELSCLGYTSKKHYHFDGALIDDERILGITTSSVDDRVKNIEVLYFG